MRFIALHRLHLCGLLILLTSQAASADPYEVFDTLDCTLLRDEAYGDHPRNRFDIALPRSAIPTPIVIYIHGGGFTSGDKIEGIKRRQDITHFLSRGIAFASINYRFYQSDDRKGVLECLGDIQRTVQYLRFHAERYNISKSDLAVYGSSAGAGASLYLAFNDDAARADDTSLLGESTRVKCAGALSTQATYDVFRWMEFVPWLRQLSWLKRKEFFNSAANFYGYPDYENLKADRETVTAKLDMLAMIGPEDPPIYLMNLQAERFPTNYNTIQHHRAHVRILEKHLSQNDVLHHAFVRQKGQESESQLPYPVREFLSDQLSR